MKTLLLVMLLIPALGWARDTADLEVTIKHLDGTVEQFSNEIAEMQILVLPDSRIKYIHLTLLSNKEKDTHVWINYENVSSFRYRFLAITGKAKVKVKKIVPFKSTEKEGLKREVPEVDPEDFR